MKIKSRDVLLVPVIIIMGKLTSFLFNALLGSYYGAGKISDAFIMAHTIPTILFEGVATAFISCYIPIYSSLKHESPEKIDDYNSNMTSISFLLSVIITLIYYAFRKEINGVYANGFDSASLQLLNSYASVLVWSIPFIGAYAIFRAYLQVNEKKTVSSIGQVATYTILIIAIIIFYPQDIYLAWATLAGNILCFILFYAQARQTGYKYRPYLSIKVPYVKTLLLMIFPIFFSTLASELASIVDKYFASRFSDGIVTSLTYGYQLSFAMQGIVSTSLLIVVFPTLAEKAALHDEEGMNIVIYKCLDIVCWMVMPLVAGGIIISHPIISVLFGHGNFSDESVVITASVFSVYLIGVLPMCIKHVGDRICFALKKTNYAMMTTLITVGINVVLDYLMSKVWGYYGLVYATGISICAGCIASFIMIKRDDQSLSYIKLLKSMIRPLICACIMAMILLGVKKLLSGFFVKNLVEIVVSLVIGVAVYIGSALVLFKSEIKRLLSYFHKTEK